MHTIIRTRAGLGLANEMPCEVQSLVAAEIKTITLWVMNTSSLLAPTQLPTYILWLNTEHVKLNLYALMSV